VKPPRNYAWQRRRANGVGVSRERSRARGNFAPRETSTREREPRGREGRGTGRTKRKRNGGKQAFPFLSAGDALCAGGTSPQESGQDSSPAAVFCRGGTETALTSHLARRYLNARGRPASQPDTSPRRYGEVVCEASRVGKLVNLYGV